MLARPASAAGPGSPGHDEFGNEPVAAGGKLLTRAAKVFNVDTPHDALDHPNNPIRSARIAVPLVKFLTP